jgi:NAD(P)-dependent dehydrogenase (short-subunit alcohol dehydrogenase family)
MKANLTGNTVVITGGASGIGAAIARKFGHEGARIFIIDMDGENAVKMQRELENTGITATAISCDVTDGKACDGAIKTILREAGGIDILVNNAGITQRSAFRDTEISVYRKVMEVNFFGSLNCTKAAIESIIERRGTIVVTSSIAGVGPLLGRTGYSASKHALHGLFESLRTEVSHLGVNIIMLCPGFTGTNLQSRALDADGSVTRHPQSTIGKQDSPAHVAEKLYSAVMKRKRILVLTASGRAGYMINRFFPSLYERIIINNFKKELER